MKKKNLNLMKKNILKINPKLNKNTIKKNT